MPKSSIRPPGRGLFYTRDSGGKHEQTPAQYVQWAIRGAEQLKLDFAASPQLIMDMIRLGQSVREDIYLDYVIKGNTTSRPALDALFERVERDTTISHVFIPRRDRLARPNDPLEGDRLETTLRSKGITIIYTNKVLTPLERGKRRKIEDLVSSVIDFDAAGKDRLELAGKMIRAQINLAEHGNSPGGRPPFYMCRWLVDANGTKVRELKEGEVVRQRGFHVMWFPGPEDKIRLALRIREMLKTTPASRVARILTAEGIPSPDYGRTRSRKKIPYRVGKEWQSNTITAVGRCKRLLALATYGERSMGDQLRFSPEGPRELSDADFREGGEPKIIRNDPTQVIAVPAKFDPLVAQQDHDELNAELDRRGESQRGKPRSKDPNNNPLGTRIFDLKCKWPMYRVPYKERFRYRCSKYMQTHGKECDHNQVDGPMATEFALSSMRQRLFTSNLRSLVRTKLLELAQSERRDTRQDDEYQQWTVDLASVERDIEIVQRNLARANSDDIYLAISHEFNALKEQERQLRQKLAENRPSRRSANTENDEVEACMESLSQIESLAKSANNHADARKLFDSVNLNLFLRFEREFTGKTTKQGPKFINRVVAGELTTGSWPLPIEIYDGPTGREFLKQENTPPESCSGGDSSFVSDEKNSSLGNVSRGDRI